MHHKNILLYLQRHAYMNVCVNFRMSLMCSLFCKCSLILLRLGIWSYLDLSFLIKRTFPRMLLQKWLENYLAQMGGIARLFAADLDNLLSFLFCRSGKSDFYLSTATIQEFSSGARCFCRLVPRALLEIWLLLTT